MLLHIRNWVITCLECSHVVICVAFGANKSIYVNCKSQCSPFGVFKACFSCLRGSMSHYIVLHNIGIIWKETLWTWYPCATLLAGLHKPFFVLVWTEQKQGFFSLNVKCQMLLFLFCFCSLCKKNRNSHFSLYSAWKSITWWNYLQHHVSSFTCWMLWFLVLNVKLFLWFNFQT